jgi:hypothetical protein
MPTISNAGFGVRLFDRIYRINGIMNLVNLVNHVQNDKNYENTRNRGEGVCWAEFVSDA